MIHYIARRLASSIPTLIGVLIVTFGILYAMPGDPIAGLVSQFESGGTPQQIAALRAQFGLDKPIYVQFVNYLGDVLHGDFGMSIIQSRPVSQLLAEALPNTAALAIAALVIAALIGIPLGVISAVRRNTWVDRGAIVVSLMGVSVPDFWLAMFAVLIFAVKLQWFPAFGVGGIYYLFLPAAVLGIRASAAVARLTRSSMLDVLNRQYVTTARAKGMGEVVVILRHALRNSMIPVMTLLGLEFGRLLAGAVVVETVFNRQGIGSLLVSGILNKDVPVIRATVLVIALIYLVVNLLVDISYSWLNPRIRYS
jgi:peptide/nickel transport system permease protein/oligopeptide transport system permease protein